MSDDALMMAALFTFQGAFWLAVGVIAGWVMWGGS